MKTIKANQRPRQQPRLPKGQRVPTYGGLPLALRRWLEREASKDGVTIAFTLTNALETVSGIDTGHSTKRRRR